MATFCEYLEEDKKKKSSKKKITKKINAKEIIRRAAQHWGDIAADAEAAGAINIGDALDAVMDDIGGGYSNEQLAEIEQILKNHHKEWWR